MQNKRKGANQMDQKLNNVEIGERIRTIREDMSMSREKFSEMIDISEVFLGQIERGECSLSLKTLSSIITHTGNSADFILYGKREETNNYMKKINRLLMHSSDNFLEFVYTLIYDIQKYNKNNSKN